VSSEMNSQQYQSAQGLAEEQPDFGHSCDEQETDSPHFFGRVVRNDFQREIGIHTESNLNGAEQELALLRHKLRRSTQQIIEVTRQKENLAGSYESQSAYLSELAARLEELEKQKAQADEQIHELTARQTVVSEQAQVVEQLNNELETARIKIGELENAIREKEGQYHHILEKVQQIETQHHQMQQTGQGVQQQNQDLQSQLTAARSQLELMGQEKDSLQARVVVLEDMEEKYRAGFNQIQQLQSQIADLQPLLDSKVKELEDTNNRLREGQENHRVVEEELCRRQDHIEQLHQTENTLREQLKDHTRRIEQMQEAGRQLQQEMTRRVVEYEKDVDSHKKENQSLQASVQDRMRENESLGKQASILKGYESQYHAARQENQTLQTALEDMRCRLELKNKEMEDAHVGWRQTHSEKQGLEKELAEKNLNLSQLQQSRNDLQQQLETLTQSHKQAQDRCQALQNEFDKSEAEYRQETSEREKEILSLQLCVRKAIEQEQSLQTRIAELEQTETKYHQTLAEHQSLQTEMDRLREEMTTARAELEQAKYQWKESQQRRLSLEDELTAEKENIRQFSLQHDMLRRQMDAKDLAIEQAQHTNRQLQYKLEKKQEQFDKDLATREQESQSLWTRLNETSDIVRQFEERFRQIKIENVRLREDIEQASGQTIQSQGRICEQNMENAALQKQISQLQHSITLCSPEADCRGDSEMQIKALEQSLAQKNADMEVSQKELQEHRTLVKELQEKLSQQAAQPQQPTQKSQTGDAADPEFSQQEEFRGHDVNGDPLKRKLYEATSRIQTLRLQLQDRTDSLKKAHQTIQLLREQRGA